MKSNRERLLALLGAAAILACLSPAGFAHSGRTDSSGGHRDNNNVSGLGSYHYHHGYGAHLHPGGYCPYTDVFPSGVRLSAEKTVLGIRETTEITAAVSPSNACSKSVSWSSSDSSVVRVNGGKITAVGFGTATITASTFNDKTSSLRITVQEITAESIALTGVDAPSKTIRIHDTLELGAVLTPENVDRPEIVWSSSDEAVAAVENGLVTGLDSGTAMITATTTNGLSAQLELTVEEVVAQKIEINPPGDITIGETVQLYSVITPADTTYQDVTWHSNDPRVVEITKDGLLTAKGVGAATIRVTQKDVRAEMKLEVLHIPVKSVSITAADGFEGTLPEGESTRFTAFVLPVDATYPEVTWTSSDPSVAVVGADGTVQALAEGQVTLTASTQDGVEASITFDTGSKLNIAALAGGVGGGGVILLAAVAVFLRKKKNTAGEAKNGVDKTTALFLTLALAVGGGAGFVGVRGTNADKYSRAIFLSSAGRPTEAAVLLKELGGYEDAAERLAALEERDPQVKFQFAETGDVVTFGVYEQDNDRENGKEPIEWLVVNKGQDRMLVLSRYVLDARPYIPYDWMDEEETDMLELYPWLYTSFAEAAFADSNTSSIRELRMLTRDEAGELSSDMRKAEYTPYAKAQKPYSGYASGYMWWLDGFFRFNGDYVGPVVWENGSCNNNSTDVDDSVGVRPAMVISLVPGEEYTFTFSTGKKDEAGVLMDAEGNIMTPSGGNAAAEGGE